MRRKRNSYVSDMFHFFARVAFLLGIVLGILVAILLTKYKERNVSTPLSKFRHAPENAEYDRWFREGGYSRTAISMDAIRYDPGLNVTLESEYLFRSVTVACVVMTKGTENTQAVRDTWSKGCNGVTFLRMEGKPKLPAIRSREKSNWVLLCRLLLETVEEFQWYLFVDDTTFVIMENLRLLLGGRDHMKGYYLGHAVTFWTTEYNIGRAGYIISQGALVQLKKALGSSDCKADTSFLNREDFYLGKHLQLLNISVEDTSDSLGLSRFHLYGWQQEFYPGINYHKVSVYPVVCCSKQAITFQAIESDKMYLYFYLLYTIQTFSGHFGNKPAPAPEEEAWKTFLKERNISTDVSKETYFRIWEDLVRDPVSFGSRFKADSSL